MDIFEQLRRDEGTRQFPYLDALGKVTIGVGHNLDDKGLTPNQIDQILKDDVAEIDLALQSIPWFSGLDDVRKGVLRNMAFNLGVHGLLGFHDTLGHMERGEWDKAAAAMLQSRWAGQVGARATRLALQLTSGEWQ